MPSRLNLFLISEAPRSRRYDFSSDGRWMTYMSYPEGAMWRSRVDGTEKLQLTRLPMQAWAPTISSDGKQVLFNAWANGEQKLYLVSLDGGTPQDLDLKAGRGEWCGEGDSIIFIEGPTQHSKTHLFHVKTSENTIIPGSDGVFLPHCSPDGRYMTAATRDFQTLRLYDFATGKWSELISHDIGFTQWSADSKYIYFDTGFSKELAVYRLRIADRSLERIVSLENFRRVVDPWVSWMGLPPDGSPLLLRDIGSQEVYALDFEQP